MTKYLNILNESDFSEFTAIEELRKNIITQNRAIKILDYGAGNPDEKRTKQEMHDGVLKKVSTKDLCRIGLKNEYAELIYALIKKFQPSTVLELGTCCGFSSLYMSKALSNAKSIIHTIEGSPETAKLAQENFNKANIKNVVSHVGRFKDVLPSLLPTLPPLDFVFIDGHHDKDATLEYYEFIKPYMAKESIVMFDDISWSHGMKEAWQIIKKDKNISSYEDFSKLGLCFIKEHQHDLV